MTETHAAPGDLAARKRELLRRRLENAGLADAPDRSDRIPRRPADAGRLPLSYAQSRMWLLQQLDPDSPAYNVCLAIRLRGPLDPDALRTALHGLLARHEVLRTRFPLAPDGTPEQVVDPTARPEFTTTDLGPLPADAQDREADALARTASGTPFDLAADHPLRALLIRRTDTDHTLVLTVHHIAWDGGTFNALSRDLGALYRAAATGEPDGLAPLPVQYADFAHWQRATWTDERLADHLDHWRASLVPTPRPLALPLDAPRTAKPAAHGDRRFHTFAPEVTERLTAYARNTGATPFMVLLAGLTALLHRTTGATDIPVGSAVMSRDLPGLEQLIGNFGNTLALRADLEGDPAFGELVERVRQVCTDGYAHQDMPFDRLVERLKPERHPGRAVWFDVMLLFLTQGLDGPRLPGVTAEWETVHNDTTQFDLSLEAFLTGGRLRVEATYRSELFTTATVDRLLERLETLLAGALADPERPLSRLPLMTEAEEHRVLAEWNGTDRPLPAATLTDLLDRQARTTPDAPALLAEDAELDHAELHARANRTARHLIARGIGPEDLVGVALDRGPDLVVTLLAVLKAGAAYLPLDTGYPAERLAFMIEDAAPALVVTTEGALPGHPAPTLLLDDPEVRADLAARDATGLTDAERLRPLRPLHPAYVIYTSGSTGRPKGAVVPHRAIVNRLLWMQDTYRLGPGERVLQKTPSGFDVSVWEFFWPLITGAALVLARPGGHRDPAHLAELIRERHVTTAHFVPSMLRVFLDDPAAAQVRGVLRRVVCSGEALPSDLAERFLALLPDTALHNLYGPTEAAVDVTAWSCVEGTRSAGGSVPIGRPVWNTRTLVLDATLRPVPPGTPGDLYLAGVQLARGYLSRPTLTAARFVADPYGPPGTRLYRTGDLVRWTADGALEFLGRTDDQVKIRGFRVEPAETEAATAAHPDVSQAAVTVRQDSDGAPMLVAYAVPRPGARPEPLRIRQDLKATLPDQLLPAAVVVLDALPLTPHGKLDRAALPAPDLTGLTTDTAPRTDAEARLCALIADLLGLPAVGIHDEFFALGGHSVLATRLVARIRAELGADVPLRAVFDTPTAAALAPLLATPADRRPALAPAERPDPLPLSSAQARLWFLYRLEGPTPTYNLPTALRLTGPLDRTALRTALDDVVARHEALRTVFPDDDGTPRQLILPADRAAVPFTVLTTRPERLDALLAEAAARPFALDSELPLRATLFALAPDEHVLLLLVHHIATDGWSAAPLLADLETAYRARRDGTPPDWAPLPVQYADHTLWQRHASDDRDRQLAYWTDVLAGLPEELQLPVDRPRPAVASYRADAVDLTLDAEVHAALGALAAEAGGTVFMALQAALAVLLGRLGGGDDIPLGTPVAGRDDPRLDDLIGLFVNTLVLRTDVSGNPTFRELLGRVREADLDAYAHQELPFEQLVDALAPTRSMGRHPLFQVMIAHQQAPDDTRDFAGLTLAEPRVPFYTAKTDLALHLFERPDSGGIAGALVHSLDLYDPATARDLADRYVRLVTELARHPDRPVAEADVLTPGERAALLGEWNDTAHPMPVTTLTALFEEQAAMTPRLTAVEYGTADGRALTYAELNARANALARRLTSLGVGPECRVGVHLERSVEMVVGLLAVLKAGGAFVPLEPSWPARRIADVCRDAGVTAVLTGPDGASPFTAGRLHEEDARSDGGRSPDAPRDPADGPVPGTPPLVPVDLGGPVPLAGNLDVPVDPEGLAYVIHTSGSTGVPKGAMIRHRAIAHRLLWQRGLLGFGTDDAALFKAPLGFDISINEIFLPLVHGGRVVIAEPGGERDVDYLLDTVERHRVTFTYLVSSMLDLLLEQDGFARRAASLRHVWCGGEVLTPELFARFRAASPAIMYHGYGPAEATIGVSHVVYRTGAIRSAVSIGRPNTNTRLYVLDERLRPTPVGVPGELYAGGVYLGRGYVNDPRRTADHWVADPYGPPGERLYRTGDLVRWQRDGTLEFLGRADNQVKIRGMRVELEEIEAVLEQHPGVRRAVVVVREDAPGVKQLAGYLLPAAPDDPVPLTGVRDWLTERVPEHMVPLTLTALDAFPLMPSGKVDRKNLPAPEAVTASTTGREPANDRERALTDLFAAVLGLASVGVDDNFFALGGDSIVSIRLVTLARKAGLALSPRQIFQTPTPAGLAAAAVGAERPAPGPADEPTGGLGLTPVMRWTAGPDGTWGGLAQAVLLVTPPDLTHQALLAVLQAVLDRHDMLRARLTDDGLEVPPEGSVRAGDLLTRATGGDIGTHLAESVARLDPRAGRMLDAVWSAPGGERPGRLLLVAHHLVVDGVSWRVIGTELAEAWPTARDGGTPRPRRTGTSFRTWSRLLAEEAVTARRVAELPWWTTTMESARPLLDRPLGTARSLREHTLVLPDDLTAALLTTLPAAYHAAAPDVLLTALALAVAAWREERTGDGGPLLVGVEGHGRVEDLADGAGPDVDLSATVGWFTTFHPVAVDPGPLDLDEALAGGPAAGTGLKRVKEQLRAVPGQGLGYGLLRHLNPETAPALEKLPQPQIAFNYLGRFSASGDDGRPWELAPEAPVLRVPTDPDRPALFGLEINAVAVEEAGATRLHLGAAWPDTFLTPPEAERLLALWERALRGLARHADTAPSGGLTPSDLPLVELTQEDIDDFENDDF